MKFGEFYSHDLKCVVVQVNKVRAKKLFCEGKKIFLHSCNMRFDNVWQHPSEVDKESAFNENWRVCYDTPAQLFSGLVAYYTFYNCDNERGKYPCFFIRKSDLS